MTPDELMKDIRRVAVEYRRMTGKPLGVTGELGEMAAASEMDITLALARQAGWDASAADGTRYQIKTRAGVRGMVPSIDLKHQFDAVLLVLLDPATLELDGIWRMPRAQVEAGLARPGSKARAERNALAISWFISNAVKLK